MEHMAVHDPVTWVIGDEFDVSRLRHADQHVIAGNPPWFRDAATLGSSDPPCVSMEVDRMMVGRAEIHQAKPHPFSQLDHQRRRQGAQRPLNVRKLNSIPWLSGIVVLGRIWNSWVMSAISRSQTGS